MPFHWLLWHSMSLHTVEVAMESAMVLPRSVMASATVTTMTRAVTAPWPMATRGACRGNPWLAMAAHGKSQWVPW